MKTIQIGNRFEIYDNNLQTHDQLPAQTYSVRFDKMTGFYLEAHSPLVIDEKVYGVHQQKVDKVLKAFAAFNRSLGVILSGDKGIGKSIFAKLLAIQAIEQGIPVIIVERFFQGVAAYIESIEQEVLVLFDEFDKTFGSIETSDNEPDPQAGLLSLFDGIAMGKKLFVVTCNELYHLNNYLVNRPGRFHYHFRFDYPSESEIREYLSDKLDEKYWSEINAVISFSRRIDLNYDCLRAIAFELNSGNSFSEAIMDLNIINTHNMYYDLSLYFKDGTILTERRCKMDMFDPDETKDVWLRNSEGCYPVLISFHPSKCVYDPVRGCSILNSDHFDINYSDSEESKESVAVSAIKNTLPLYLAVTRSRSKDIHFKA